MIQRIKHYLFYPRFHFSRFQFNLVTLFFLTVGMICGSYFALPKIVPYVFALNDTTKTWTFSLSTTGDYTKSQIDGETVMAVDDNGAHPTGGTVGANELTNPAFASDNSSWSVAAIPPSGWVEVPGNATFGTSNFLAMKYEAKCDTDSDGIGNTTASGNVCNGSSIADGTGDQYGTYRDSGSGCACTSPKQVVSSAAGFPIAYIFHNTAITYCGNVTLNGNAAHLVRNDEWMTIARNAEAQTANWCTAVGGYGVYPCGNSPGTGMLASGHNDNVNEAENGDTNLALEASSDDSYACYRTTTGATTCDATSGKQRRTFSLSNASVIWDIPGNVWEHVQRSTNNAGDDTTVMNPLPACSDNGAAWGWCQYGSTTTPYVSSWTSSVVRDYVGPLSTSYNSAQGVGQVYTYKNGTSQSTTVFLRGAVWSVTSNAGAFTLYSPSPTSTTYYSVGFRCASDPVAISQSFSSSSGRAGGGDTITIGSISDGKIYQSVNVGDTSTYDFSVWVYNTSPAGGTVDGTVAQLYYNGAAVTTSYTEDVSTHWWKLSGTLTGANASREYGVLVKAGKTVKADDFTLSKQGTYSVYTTSAYSNSAVSSWDSFSASVTASGNAAIYYQICLDDGSSCSYSSGSRWQYYTAGAWANASDATTTYANTAAQLTQAAMQALPTASQKISIKAIMNFGGADVPYLTSLQIGLTTDVAPPSISLTALSPDPNTDSTPAISGTATEDMGTVSSVSFQIDSTSGSWSNCSADDGTFDEITEGFTCSITSALSDGSHTIYVRATDSNNNTTASGSEATDAFTVDTTAPASIDLDAPGSNSYTNSERSTFKWKTTTDATAGLSKYVLEIDNSSLGSGQPSGDFTIDDIPTSRTTDYETNKYVIHYENFSDSDATNNYISIYTKSHSDWGSSENDGKLREGRVSWKVKARDNAGNETSSSRTLFVDRTNPKMEFTQVNNTPFSSSSFSTTDKTPTIYGKISDPLAGGDSSQTQDENGPKIASGPKQVEIKVEKKEGLTYKLHTLYTINIDKPWYSCDGKEVTDNSKQKCDKYLPFEFTPEQSLDLGTYLVTITGKDKADNTSSSQQFTLNIATFAQITTLEEKKVVEEKLRELPKEEQEKVKEELEITKPTEAEKPTVLERVGSKIADTFANLWWGLVDTGKTTINVLANAWSNYQAFVTETSQKTLALAKIIVGRTTSVITQSLAFIGQQLDKTLTAFGKTTQTLLAATRQGIGNTAKSIGEGYSQLANNAPGVTKTILIAVGNGVSAVGNTANSVATIATSSIANISETVSGVAQNTAAGVETVGKIIANATNGVGQGISQIANIISGVGVKLAQNIGTTTANTFGPLTTDISSKTGRLAQKVTTFVAIATEYWFDREPTKILAVSVEKVTPTSAVIYWKTNHHATSAVNYGFDTSYGKKVQTDERVKEHRLELTNLAPGKTYFFEVMSQNKNYVYDAYYTLTTPSDEKIKGATTEKQVFKKPWVLVVGNKNDWILVRREPSRESDVVAKVQVGQPLPLLKEQDGWLLIKFDGSEGWMFGEFGKLIEPQE